MATRVELSTTDPERALPTLEEYFPGVRMSNPYGNFALELVAADVGAMSTVNYRLKSQASSSSADLSANYTVGQLDVGSMGLAAEGGEIDTTQPWLFPSTRVNASWDDVTITTLTLSRAATERMARAQVGSDSAALTFTALAPVSVARARQWRSLVAYTRQALTDEQSSMDSPLVRTSAFAHLVGLMLETFPNTITATALERARPSTAPSAVRRALAFIDQNAHLPISVEDIARESRLSIRALQYAFQRHLGSSPIAALRRARLDGAHRELQRTDPGSGATVASVGLAWGFGNAGRFSAQYREAYGVSPKVTLND